MNNFNYASIGNNYPFFQLEHSDPSTIFRFLYPLPNSSCIVARPFQVDPITYTISHSEGLETVINSLDTIPLYTRKNTVIASTLDPIGLIYRTNIASNLSFQKHNQILKSLYTCEPPPYQAKWLNIDPKIKWDLAIKQRRSAFIPHKEKDILLRVHCNTLPTAQRLHLPNVPPECDFCLLPNAQPTPHQITDYLLTPSNTPNPIPKEETLHHFLFECPASTPIINSLKNVVFNHLGTAVSAPSQLLFPIPHTPKHGFPFILLVSTAIRQMWLNRCNRRFEHTQRHPKSLLFVILHLFRVYCTSYLNSLKEKKTKKSKHLLTTYLKSATKYQFLYLTPSGSVSLHPNLVRTWLLTEPTHPP